MWFQLFSICWIISQMTLTYSQEVKCWYGPGGSTECSMDITAWNAASSPYDCSAGPQYTLAEAAAGSRVRRDVYQLTENATHQQELHDLLFALTCSINEGQVSVSDYAEGSWGWVNTYHGIPGWFEDCYNNQDEGTNQGRNVPGCCNHGNPTFPSWHRLLMVDYEIALRRWNLNVAVPYWNWLHDPLTISRSKLPDLISNATVWDPIISQYVKNPYFNYEVPVTVRQYTISSGNTRRGYCPSNHSCRDPTEDKAPLFKVLTAAAAAAAHQKSLYIYIKYAFEQQKWVDFNGLLEKPHDLVHVYLGGNMRSQWLATYDPIFNFHHSQCERLFVIWEKLMLAKGIDYSDPKTRLKLITYKVIKDTLMDVGLPPFNNSNYNAETLTLDTSGDAFQSIPYTKYHYEYDSYDPVPGVLTFDDISAAYDAKFASDRSFIGFYQHYIGEPYTVDFAVSRLSNASEILVEGSYGIMGPDAANRADPRDLYRIEITDELNDAGLPLDTLLNVSHTVSTGNDSIVLPAFQIYFDSSTMTETNYAYWGEEYDYQNVSIILNPHPSNAGITSRLLLVDIDADNTFIPDLFYAAEPLEYNSSDAISFGTATTDEGVSYSTAEFVTATSDASDTATYFKSSSCTNCLYPYSANCISDSSTAFNIYLSQTAVLGYDPYITFEEEAPQIGEFGVLRFPFDSVYLESGLYNQTQDISSIDDFHVVSFIDPDGDEEESSDSQVCRVSTEYEYEQCDSSAALSCDDAQDLTSNGTYYFISSDEDECNEGLKVILAVGTTPDCNVSSNLYSYNKLGTNQYLNMSIDATTCEMWLNVSSEPYTWFAYGLFGPWDLLTPMKGTASVYKSWISDVTLYDLCGGGCHTAYPSNENCVTDEIVDGYRYVKCSFILEHEYFQHWTGHEFLKANEDYTTLYAYYDGDTQAFDPSTKHTNIPGIDGEHTYRFCTTADDATCILGFDDNESGANQFAFAISYFVVECVVLMVALL